MYARYVHLIFLFVLLPAMSIPAGLSQKMPVGLQMIGNYWSESKLLNIAHQFQQQTDWHAQTP
jgi:aspartyl-tRNA(Asn)/glutamyl-tRNA(Gln) amidotransferase subunit A